jgi:hypothetical protein
MEEMVAFEISAFTRPRLAHPRRQPPKSDTENNNNNKTNTTPNRRGGPRSRKAYVPKTQQTSETDHADLTTSQTTTSTPQLPTTDAPIQTKPIEPSPKPNEPKPSASKPTPAIRVRNPAKLHEEWRPKYYQIKLGINISDNEAIQRYVR